MQATNPIFETQGKYHQKAISDPTKRTYILQKFNLKKKHHRTQQNSKNHSILILCLQDVFSTLCQLDESRYFLCRMEEVKFIAEAIDHVPMELKDRYVFCCSPIPKKVPVVVTMFLKVSAILCLDCLNQMFNV